MGPPLRSTLIAVAFAVVTTSSNSDACFEGACTSDGADDWAQRCRSTLETAGLWEGQGWQFVEPRDATLPVVWLSEHAACTALASTRGRRPSVAAAPDASGGCAGLHEWDWLFDVLLANAPVSATRGVVGEPLADWAAHSGAPGRLRLQPGVVDAPASARRLSGFRGRWSSAVRAPQPSGSRTRPAGAHTTTNRRCGASLSSCGTTASSLGAWRPSKRRGSGHDGRARPSEWRCPWASGPASGTAPAMRAPTRRPAT